MVLSLLILTIYGNVEQGWSSVDDIDTQIRDDELMMVSIAGN